MATVIKVENVSKQYRLGNVGSGTMRDDLTRWWYRMQGKEDPLLKIGSTNDRSQKADSDYVWALKDINFEVQQGDVLGIIGRNGAGKSTLLKILSKTTAPTTGSVKVKGRIASLLEVGTGFHPELTGRENIYLNGAILGMRKHEITRKLDEIIDFAGVERYIDTPVKRYSSGMYVRLAFGVAAHLESEILIIDEVLAVGDAEFQKKCLGKMGEVSKGEGRTVLFVSHNLGAINALCKTGILLLNGKLSKSGLIDDVSKQYVGLNHKLNTRADFLEDNKYDWGAIKLNQVFIDSKGQFYYNDEEISIVASFVVSQIISFYMILIIRGESGDIVFEHPYSIINNDIGKRTVKFTIPKNILNKGQYRVQINFHNLNTDMIGSVQDAIGFDIEISKKEKSTQAITAGFLRPAISVTEA
jgi:lipopolysaccharide transport system ATP-binding protein